jgi:methyl-accepting chemotaxis protein
MTEKYNPEYILTDHDLIVSKTDLKGIITFVNDDLTRISGYSKDELIGKAHNIFRHGDMPKEVFADMWQTIKHGHSWSGLVKNKTKSGRFYWVRAHITAIYENGKIVGYMSVRRRPKRENVIIAANAYKDIIGGKFQGIIKRGSIIKNTFSQKILNIFKNATIKNKFMALSLFCVLDLVAIFVIGLSVISGADIKQFYPLIGFIFIMALIGSFILLVSIKKYVLEPLRYITDSLTQISQGNYFIYMDYYTDNEIGQLMEAVRTMAIRLGFDISDARKKEDEYLRLKIGLDNAATGIVITNQENKIVYINNTANEIFKDLEYEEFKKLSTSDNRFLVGKKIDVLQSPEIQKFFNENFKSTKYLQTQIGNKYLQLKANSITNEHGIYLGVVSEWADITVRKELKEGISGIVRSAINGNFEQRIHLSSENVLFNELSTEINELLEICEKAFFDFKRVFSNMVLGDLTHQIVDKYQGDFDHLKQDANLAVVQLNNIILELTNAIGVIGGNIEHITKETHELSRRTENQLADLNCIASTTHTLMTAVYQNDEYAKKANSMTTDAFDIASKSVEAIENVIRIMDDIRASSSKIFEIVTVIDEIAFQTNILAVNAAIEAARAGEQGRGFAVVAVEVRNLAQRVVVAAGEITELINESEIQIVTGNHVVSSTGEIIKEVSSSIETVIDMVKQISAACSNQSEEIKKVDSAITDIKNSIEQNANLVISTTNSSITLNSEIKGLKATASYFVVEKQTVDFDIF